jgi:SAM-dependent methyltransferase
MAYADARFWDQYFRGLREAGDDLDWGGRWTEPFLVPLRQAGARTILELGCGTGNDAARLARKGYAVTAIDLSAEAIERARDKFGSSARFLVADMAVRLPFPDSSFDAVMSNVALHMFPDSDTRLVFAEVARLVRPDGLFLFHVNALEDRPLRARWRPVGRELEKDYVLEESGQTMHFFSEPYLSELLLEWSELRLGPVEIADRETGEKFKQVWRGIARRLVKINLG